MFIAKVVNCGKPYLQVMDSYSIVIDGVRKNRHRTLRNLGPLDRFDDGKPDFMKRLRQSFKDGKPIIPGLDDLISNARPPKKITMEFDREDEGTAFSDPKHAGHFLLDGLFDALGIHDVLSKHKSKTKIEYDLAGLAKLLIFGRVIDPASKISTWDSRSRYLFGVTDSEDSIEVYRALDVLDEESSRIQMRMNSKIRDGIGRNTDICFYDVTNYWFEINSNDEDTVDDDGVVTDGLRKAGISKAHNRKPIVQMGLFMDDNGIPISYELFPGNHIDQTTLRPAMKKSIGKMDFGRVVVVADGGCNSGKNKLHILDGGNGYIISKSAKGSDKDTRKWILDGAGYRMNEKGTFKIKSMIRKRVIEDENGIKREIEEKIISYWSKKHYDYAIHENEGFMRYLEEVRAHPDKLKDKQKRYQKYIKKYIIDPKTGKKVPKKDAKVELVLDEVKIEEDLSLMGYYTLLTSEFDMADQEVIDKYHGLTRIEDAFRITKSQLEGRPVYVHDPGHINAHCLICFIALTMIRIIQWRILNMQDRPSNAARDWEMGLPAERIQKALSEFCADALPGGYYRMTRPTDDLKLLMGSFGIDTDLRIPTLHDLKQWKFAIRKTDFM
jgi:transposase